jgi:flavin reductase (DIM6/NTAB) family NADH-FMN oxidoreductase RutF/uncharacterized protein with FMN-binding domain
MILLLLGIPHALSQIKDGTYRGSCEGHVGKITVEMTVEQGRIARVQVIENAEYENEEALREMPVRIVKAQSTKDVDGVTGATVTSTAILKAVETALQAASGESSVSSKVNLSVTSDEIEKKSLGSGTFLPAPVWVIGSYDKEGKSNFMAAAWVGICCSRPPCVTIALRKATYTYGNIMERKAYTVNVPSQAFINETVYFGSVSGRDVDKIAATRLTPVRSDSVDAPYLKEFPLVVECRVIQTLEVGSHTMFIGEIKDVKAHKSVLDENGQIDVEKLNTFLYSPSNQSFYKTGAFFGTLSDFREQRKE